MEKTNPKIRLVEFRPITYEGREYFMLRDPLRLEEQTLFIPRPLAPVLILCDGLRDEAGIAAALAVRYGGSFPLDVIHDVIHSLDQACLLENERFEAARQAALADFHAAPFRTPVCAGNAYPEKAAALRSRLDEYIEAVDGHKPVSDDNQPVRGLISPHIDYARGGRTYARVWKPAARAVQEADVAVIFGTDHNSARSLFTLTRQQYASPLGPIRTDLDVVDALAAVLGDEAAFGEELNHRHEHSLELAAVWLQHTAGDQAGGGHTPAIVPVLTGDILSHPGGEALTAVFVDTLKKGLAGKQVLYVAAADLAHVGPAFDGPGLDAAGKDAIRVADEALIARMLAGDAEGFLAEIRKVENRHNVCGVTPIYLTLKASRASSGRLAAYEQCPADEAGTSIVSICGVLLE